MKMYPAADKISQILIGAQAMFLEHGYTNTSMDAIAQRSNVSKTTLYSHFVGKEHLFGAVISQAKRRLHATLHSLSTTGAPDVRTMLHRFGVEFLERITEPELIAVFRVVIGESRQFPEMARELSQCGSEIVLDHVSRTLAVWSRQGLITAPDSRSAAMHLVSLLKTDIQFLCVLDPGKVVTSAEINKRVQAALDLFLSRYGR